MKNLCWKSIFLILLISTLLPFSGVSEASSATPLKNNYYFVYNSSKIDSKDLAAIKQYVNKFKTTNNVLFDAKGYTEATKLLDALKTRQKKIGGSVAGVQIFGIADDVPAFTYTHKMRISDPEGKWARIEENKNEKYMTDFFYSTFKNDSKYLKDISMYQVFEEGVPVSMTPEWPVSRLPLTKGEIAGYISRYDSYRKQISGKSIPTASFDVPVIYQPKLEVAQDDINYFLDRLKDEFGLFKNVQYRTYYKDLAENLKKENKAGVADFLIGTMYGGNDGAYQKSGNKDAIIDRKTINNTLSSNYYTALLWGFNSAKGLGTDSFVHDGMAKGKLINPIAHTGSAGNNGVWNYIWAWIEEENPEDSGYWYKKVDMEDLRTNNQYYFIYNYYASLDQGKSRLQSFHDAKVEYAKALMDHRDVSKGHLWESNYQYGFEVIMSLHYLGLADYE